MGIIKCKMCGGDLYLIEGASTAECQFCGSVQTVPQLDDDKKLLQFERAERLRKQCEFDKAAGIYENIVADFRQEAEAYWGLVLCKYGIEYVDDPATGKKIPTCHRSSFDSIMDDPDLELALENADGAARKVYRDEAKVIEQIRKGIVAVSANEDPYDIFICYKETAEQGERTLDSVLAQDVYDVLTDKGYRVFFSRITLEDKLGVEYEPYIFAALNSAKIMLVFGTDYEYFNAVWVKNEWSRFLKLMAKEKEKSLIPCYKGIDAYDMPKEFARLQAQDLGKVGAMQDLLRGVAKILAPRVSTPVVAPPAPVVTSPLVMRGQFALDDGDWKRADEYFERALDENPQDSQAYVGKVLVTLRLSAVEQINDRFVKLDGDRNFDRAIQFATGAEKAKLESIKDKANKKWLVKRLADGLAKIARKKEAEVQLENRLQKQNEEQYAAAVAGMERAVNFEDYWKCSQKFVWLQGYRDAENLAKECLRQYERLKTQHDATVEREAAERKAEEARRLAVLKAEEEKRLEQVKVLNDQIKAKIAQCEQKLREQKAIYEANANKIFGAGAKMKKDSKAEIARLEGAIAALRQRLL